MVNAVSMTKVEYVERKLAYATCTRTREILPRDRVINLNEFSPGLGWTFFPQPGHNMQQKNQKTALPVQDSLYPRIARPERKTSSARVYSRARVGTYLMSLRRGRLR
jgi:hypothetical protein